MADEFKISAQGSVETGLLHIVIPSYQMTADLERETAHSTVVVVGSAAEEDMPVGDVDSPGVLILKNLDTVNHVTYGPKNGSNVMETMARLAPGDRHILRLDPNVTLRWQADTDDVNVEMLLLDASPAPTTTAAPTTT